MRKPCKTMRMTILAFLAAALTMPAILDAQISPRRIIRNVEDKLTSAKTVRVAFEEVYVWTMTGDEQAMEGILLMEENDRFRVITADQVIVSDGKTLWTYSESSHRVLIDRLDASEGAMLPRQILFQYTEDYQSRVSGEETVEGKPCHILTFTSETGDEFFPQVRVWVDQKEWIPWQVEQTDINENKTLYRLKAVEIGVELEEGTFSFPIPDGAEVIDMR